MRVLFVCSGNLCRSPMAAEYARRRAAEIGLNDLVITSAGTLGIVGEPATPDAVATLQGHGIDLEGHRSSALGPDNLAAADLVVVMADRHRREIDKRFPGHGKVVHLIRAFENDTAPAPSAPDLDDPIGKPIGVYRTAFDLIRRSTDNLLKSLTRP